MLLESILFVTDNCEYKKDYTIKSRDSEGNKINARDEMLTVLRNFSDNVHLTYSLKEANNFIIKHPNTFVVSTFYGTAAADSKSLMPAICAANNVKYLGADSYTQMICNDKFLSKAYMKNFGLVGCPGNIIYSPDSFINEAVIGSMKKPIVVKPNFGGGSNGIANKSLTNTTEETLALVKELYQYQKMPILVEEYIPGFEVSVVIIGNKKDIAFLGESNLILKNKAFFENEIYGLEYKKISPEDKRYEKSKFIDIKTKEKMVKLFQSFDKAEFMRIDCRITQSGEIFILELSPDCYVGTSGAFYETVKQSGVNFHDMMERMLTNSINNQNY